MTQPTLLLVDGSSYLYRAFYAMTHLTSPQGMPTNAIYGVLNMLRRSRSEVEHDYACCVFDAKGKNFRHQLFSDYKATRPPMPDDLRPQADLLPELVELMGWKVLKVEGVEADDILGTLAKTAEAQGMKTIISTGDKDMAQLVNPHITLVNTMSNETLDIDGVIAKFGVKPEQIIDYLALIGDKVDNVPGVEKCGPKTAVKWLEQYQTLDNVMAHASEIKGKVGENLQAALNYLPLSYQLITIKTNVDLQQELPNGLNDLQRQNPNWAQLIPHFQELGFKTWLKEAQNQVSPAPQSADLFDIETPKLPAKSVEFAPAPDQVNYRAITNQTQLQEILSRLEQSTLIAIDTETTSLDNMSAEIIGISIAFNAGEAVYIPLNHDITIVSDQLPFQATLDALKPHLENSNLKKIGQNIKYDCHVFANANIQLNGIVGDSMLASYIVESHLGHGLDELSLRHLNLPTIQYEDICGKGAKAISFAAVDLETATAYACQDADFSWRIEHHLKAQMSAKQLDLYEKLELPISHILFQMERQGILLDKQELSQQSRELSKTLIELEQKAYEMAGQPFNLNSPKQLQEILFGKLGIPTKGVKKTTTGGFSTNESVLEELALNYPLPKLILQTRSLSKLKSTYTDKLPEMMNPKTGRVHTNYAQAVAITGRLASNNPNLQNIPIRTPEGRRVRRAFCADPNQLIVSADYSQIELRIMAHLSADKTLIDAFQNHEDIHRRTAAEIFNISPENVSAEQRRYAKTINFGLIYGMGQYGLAKALNIDTASAKLFIERYFARYPGVADYMQRTKEQAYQQGFVETLFGRRLYLPDIQSSNAKLRAGAERAAINAPMQGTASDLIKQAMIAVAHWLEQEKLNSRLLLQVHDELILEAPQNELALVQENLPKLMALEGNQLNVPLLAEIGFGNNWEEAH